MSIGERIASARKNKNISQYQLAQTLGVSRQAVSKWENGQSSPDTLNLIKLADLLDTDVEYLATGNLSPKPPAPVSVNLVRTVEVEKIVERVVEKPVIRKVTRIRYRRDRLEYTVLGVICFILGFLVGLIF